MSPAIVEELHFLLYSFWVGVVITAAYDVLRIVRNIIRHNRLAVSLQDILYWVACALLIFGMLVRENNGTLRWFSVAGATVGMFLYKKTLGFLFVKYGTLLIQKILYLVEKVLIFILKPLNLVRRRLFWIAKKAGKQRKMGLRGIKKKLTEGKKLLKIILCKQ